MNLASLEQWCWSKHLEICLWNITVMRTFCLDVESAVITTTQLEKSLQTRSSAFHVSDLITGLLCLLFWLCIFLIIWIHCKLSNRLDSEEAQQCKSLKWLSRINIFTLNLSLFWKMSLGGHGQFSKAQAFPTVTSDYTMEIIMGNTNASNTFP